MKIGLVLCVCLAKLSFYVCQVTVSKVNMGATVCGHFNCSKYGDCVPGPSGSKCVCHAGYTGKDCSEDKDECSQSDTVCFHRGYCQNSFGSFSCDCLTGWYGSHCHGKNHTSTEWLCLPGWMGDDCFDQCLPNNSYSCSPTRKCIKQGRHYSCACDDGYRGDSCTDVNECLSNPCTAPKLRCLNTPGSFSCSCPIGWTGDTCSDDVNECVTGICKNGASCNNTHGSYRCKCTNGWEGRNCDTDIDECLQSSCNDSEMCINAAGSFSCLLKKSLKYPEIPQYKMNKSVTITSFVVPMVIVAAIIIVLLLRNRSSKENRWHQNMVHVQHL